MFQRIREFLSRKKLQRTVAKVNLEKDIWLHEKPLILQENEINNEKYELKKKKKIHFPSWSKLLLIFLFINFSFLEIFVGWVTIESFDLAFETGMGPDFTPLITLISAVIGETISYGIYCAKSKAENTEGGIVFESARWKNIQNEDDEEIDG